MRHTNRKFRRVTTWVVALTLIMQMGFATTAMASTVDEPDEYSDAAEVVPESEIEVLEESVPAEAYAAESIEYAEEDAEEAEEIAGVDAEEIAGADAGEITSYALESIEYLKSIGPDEAEDAEADEAEAEESSEDSEPEVDADDSVEVSDIYVGEGIVAEMAYSDGSGFPMLLADTDTAEVSYTVTYKQTEARTMLDMINEFRKSDDAWYWNSDNTTKTVLTGTLSDFSYDYDLENIAMQRAAETAIYWDHTRPSGDAWSLAYTEYRSDHATFVYTAAAENIAAGQSTASSAFTTWQETDDDYSGQSHRRAMLSSSYNAIGIACVVFNGTYYWVQELGYTNLNSTATDANDSTETVTAKVAASSLASASFSADPTSYSMSVGETAATPAVSGTIQTIEAYPKRGSSVSIVSPEWSVTDTSVASISGDTLSALKAGTTSLTATILGQSLSADVTVTQSIAGCTITVDPSTCTYDGSEQTPKVIVTDGDTTLTEGTDYTLSYSDNVNVGTATVTVTGAGLYGGSDVASFTITPADISTCTAVIDPSAYTYTGSAIEPDVTVANGSTTLTAGTDYTVSYSNNTDIGTATVTITGTGNYTGTLTATFTIVAEMIDYYTVTFSEDTYVYDGTAKEPSVTVSNGTKTLTQGTDYTVAYDENVNAGTATVTVTGTGNYGGTASATFTISQREVTPSITGTTTKVYDGTTAAPKDLSIELANVVSGDDVSATAGSYTYNSAEVADASTITASGIVLAGTSAGNYTLSDTTASTAGAITKAAASIAFVSGYSLDKTYDGTAVSDPSSSDLELSGATYNDIVFTWYDGSSTSGTAVSAPTDAGTYTLLASVSESSNYTAAEAEITFIIGKASYTPDGVSKTVVAEHVSEGVSVDVSSLIKDGGTIGTPTADGELIDSASLSAADGTVSFDTTAQPEDTTAVITVPVTGCTNYEDYEITITVAARAVVVEASGTIEGYTGVPIDGAVITLKITDGGTTFAETLTGEEWITNLPAGLSQTIERVDDTTVEITVSGTAADVEDEAIEIVIPAGNIVGVSDELDVSGEADSIDIELATYTLELTDTSGSFADLTYGYENGSSVTYTFTNTGNQTLTGITASTEGEFTAEVSDESVEPGETVTVTVTSNTGMTAGTNVGTLTVNWTNAEDVLTEELSQIVLQASNSLSISTESSKTYDGSSVSVSVNAKFGDASLTWFDEEGNELDGAPVDAGSYTVRATVEETADYAGASASAEFVIDPAVPVVRLADKEADYTGEVIAIDPAEVTLVNGEEYTGEITYTYYSDEDCTRELDGAPSDAGTFYVVASIAASGNYTEAKSDVAKLTIKEETTDENPEPKKDDNGGGGEPDTGNGGNNQPKGTITDQPDSGGSGSGTGSTDGSGTGSTTGAGTSDVSSMVPWLVLAIIAAMACILVPLVSGRRETRK